MSEQTNNLLNLFSKLLHNPNILFALRADGISKQMKNRGNRMELKVYSLNYGIKMV